jgi:hypothetical protein
MVGASIVNIVVFHSGAVVLTIALCIVSVLIARNDFGRCPNRRDSISRQLRLRLGNTCDASSDQKLTTKHEEIRPQPPAEHRIKQKPPIQPLPEEKL